ncbi:MAG: YqeG family HAD IIIA-type phosphatase [Armatimonadota bacterium]
MWDRFRPHHIARCLNEVDCGDLVERGIRGVLLDLDNTITEWHSMDILPEIEAWVAQLKEAGLLGCIISNAVTAGRVQPIADRLGLPWITRAMKPFPIAFRSGMRMMGTTPETTAIVGDQLFTDILGGNRVGLYTILVEPFSCSESIHTRLLHRPLERLIGRIPKDHPAQ